LDGEGEVAHERRRVLGRERAFLELLREQTALNKLERDPARLVGHARVEDLDDPRVAEPRRRARLAHEAIDDLPVRDLADRLERDLAPEPRVVGAVDDAHAAAAELSAEAVQPERARELVRAALVRPLDRDNRKIDGRAHVTEE